MQLTTMQDVGGCRAIVNTLEQANALAEWYKTSAAELGQFEYFANSKYDYIAHPKEDGYRSIHVIARSKSQEPNIQSRRIEIQIRTRLQHQWATAVETVDFFAKQKIKSGGGNPKWRRFFALTGSMFAGKERCPLIPNTPGTLQEIVDECFDLWHDLNVLQLLRSWSAAMKLMEYPESEAFPPNSMCLVELDVRAKTTNINTFRSDQVDEAKANYTAKEKEIGADPMRSVVLVSADSMAELKAAYPSYYGDTEAFLEAVVFLLSIKQKPLR
jgi:Region found in RelA / SpoT proteins